MNAKVAKILGDNLDSNSSMVLFNDVKVTIPTGSVSEQYDLAVFDTIDEANSVYYELEEYLNKMAKSHAIIARPKISVEDLGVTTIVPSVYVVDGTFMPQFLYEPVSGTTVVASAYISSGTDISEAAYAVRITFTMTVLS